jgi:membrane protein implicated in regulation of membrane protease activity
VIPVLLWLPVLAAIAVPLYARENPRLAGVPFFYWYQFACLLLTAVVLAVALRLRRGSP